MSINCPGGQVYVIRSGDTLFLLARRFNTTVNAILAANPGINPYNLMIGQRICIPVPPGPPPPVPRPRCIVLAPTDITPNSKGMVFVETDRGSVLGLVTNVPQPTVLPGGEVYKLWVKTPLVIHWAVTTMAELLPGYWIARLVPGFALAGADVIISAETQANTTAPAGLGVAVGTIQ